MHMYWLRKSTTPEGAEMDLLEIAREAGFAVLLEARIGGHEYSSVCG